ncbi:MAS20 protein import receptor-domain-containing protein [Lobosporangium transversale]|uniref:MAS20 protein import receptor-domain-containing protein n=1 Tax=Lobosporangium transversale TaxID=64571 RepID=A0A1Y2GK58_9FUNG|nr:MAS20 protein import receptor-domain-containing protein [Lobosporangium transversale]ORZ11334.1 MAS20 protein import receptor-domain-containing protein [Lobosporangium transversale]|eukprot:XP_021879649.1 MAS20 protein import receptor-domain-containing protein [Lobosporangium transversale]
MKTSTIVAATVGVLTVATIGYAIYFDAKRRNDPEFRRKLKKERKRAQKLALEEAKKLSNRSAQTVEEALASIKDEDFPTSMEEREKFCMEQLSAGEALFTRGPQNYAQAAICFYKALKVYPAPAELVMVYQKTIPSEVFTLVMGMLSKDVQSKQEKYYTVFPPEDMNVKVDEKPEGVTADGQKVTRRGLVVTKAFTAGQAIYSEVPVINSLEPSLEGSFCHYCLKEIVQESAVPCSKCSQVVFCSQDCKDAASQEFHNILCTKNSEDADSPERSLYEYTKTTRNLVPEMLAKFLVKMVHEESMNSGAEYNSFDHMERLRYLEIPPSDEEEKEMELLKVALGSNIPGIDEFITAERYLLMKGRLLYNLYGISTSLDTDRTIKYLPERQRSIRDAPITGSGLYRVSSYLMHSCEPNTKIVFSDHDHKLTIVATRDIQAGDELFVGYIKNGKLSTEQRRLELFTKYRLQCMCPLCETTD